MHKKIFYIVNVDWFFLSHRLSLALAMKAKGYEVHVLTKDSGMRDCIEGHGLKFKNINFDRSGKNPFSDLVALIKICWLLKVDTPDIIHNVTIKPVIYGSIAVKLSREKSIKLINAISGLGYNFTDNRDGILQRFLMMLMRFAYRGNSHFIFQNSDDRDLYERLGFLLTNNYRIIKGAGVDIDEFSFNLPVAKNKIDIVLIARMLIDKGVVEFINAANILKCRYENSVRFLLVGDVDDDNLASLKKEDLMSALVPGYLDWVGFRKDIKQILIRSDIACLPSFREGLPKSLVEAMAIGRPIVATDVPGCRECVDNGKNGFLVPPRDAKQLADALRILIDNPELRLEMGKVSRAKMIAEFSLKRIIAETLEYYEKD